MDSTQVGIFKETDQVGFGGFLERQDGRSLEAQITLEILSDFTDQTLKGQLSNQKIGALLVPTNLAKGDGSGPVSMGLLDTSGGGGGLAGSLSGELFSGGLSSSGLAGGLV